MANCYLALLVRTHIGHSCLSCVKIFVCNKGGLYSVLRLRVFFNVYQLLYLFVTVCWSPKGKQLAVGHKDGRVSQFSPVSISKVLQW